MATTRSSNDSGRYSVVIPISIGFAFLAVTVGVLILTLITRGGERQQDRDFKVFRNIMILFGIYLSGGIPTATVAVKNSVTLFLDRELFNALKKFIRRRNTRVMPALS
ncbi:unnamed protein product [Rotaria magnacalcarata]|uniref:Uncharacterized protein n=1 Tax=Rotaria magnacalcarata TaxID=392030 RepID=A0A816PUD6_9BILA|nr:unnamed protein product [Rotaria magnacalcarata]